MNFYIYLGIFIAVDLLLVAYILYARSRKRFVQRDLRFFFNEWQKILAQRDGKHAILDADKLLHHVLGKKGYQGNVGDQLKNSAKLFTSINDVWFAHKLRNRIAHEMDMHLNEGDRHRAIRYFEKALQDLGAL